MRILGPASRAVTFVAVGIFASSCGETLEVASLFPGALTVGSEGGTLTVTDARHPLVGLQVSFPAGAVPRGTTVQVREAPSFIADDPHVSTAFELAPADLVTARTVIVQVPIMAIMPGSAWRNTPDGPVVVATDLTAERHDDGRPATVRFMISQLGVYQLSRVSGR